MRYDVFTTYDELAKRLDLAVLLREGQFEIDDMEHPHIYQFFDLDEQQVRTAREILIQSASLVEIRDADKGGAYVWPVNDSKGNRNHSAKLADILASV